MGDQEGPMQKYEECYQKLLLDLVGAASELAVAGDIQGLRFLIECVDSIFGRALLILELRHTQEVGGMN